MVLTWLRFIHSDLPGLVKQSYTTELRSRILASLIPEISQALDSLFEEIRSTTDSRVLPPLPQGSGSYLLALLTNRLHSHVLPTSDHNLLHHVNWHGAKDHFRISLNFFRKASLSAHPFIWKWDFIHLQIQLIFIWMVVHQASLWWRGLSELGNGLFISTS